MLFVLWNSHYANWDYHGALSGNNDRDGLQVA